MVYSVPYLDIKNLFSSFLDPSHHRVCFFFFSCFLPINSLLNFPRFRIYEFPLLISIRMINCPAATPRKKDLFDRNMCTRMGKFNEKSEKDFFRAMAVYIYMMDSLLVFFFSFFIFGGRVMRFWTREQTVRNAHCSLDRIPRFSNGSTVYRNVSICSTKSGPNGLTRWIFRLESLLTFPVFSISK